MLCEVCYVYFERLGAVTLLIVYAKSEMDDLPERMKPALTRQSTRSKRIWREFFAGDNNDKSRKGTA